MLKPGGARNKGHDGEREMVRLLGAVVEEIVGRQMLKRNLNQTRDGGHDIAGLDFLALEVKRQETLDVESWWRQTLTQAEKAGGLTPVLVYRQNGRKWQVMMLGEVGPIFCRVQISFEDFKRWLRLELGNRMRRGEVISLLGFEGKEVGEVGMDKKTVL